MADNNFENYKNTTKYVSKARIGSVVGTARKNYVVTDKNGNVVNVEKGPIERLDLKPATTEEVFGTGKIQKKQERNPISSETKVNNTDVTKEWMSVADMLEGK